MIGDHLVFKEKNTLVCKYKRTAPVKGTILKKKRFLDKKKQKSLNPVEIYYLCIVHVIM